MPVDPVLTAVVRKLKTRSDLDNADVAAIMTLPYALHTYEPSAYLVREGAAPGPTCQFMVSGLAFRQKLTAGGARQIMSVYMAGDFLDLQHLFLRVADHNVQALTRTRCAELDRHAIEALALKRPGVARALWIDTLVEASVFREWILNVGRRDARAAVAHFLCEFAVRMQAAGLADRTGYELPMTQEQIGDATGLTSVHVNRTFKALVAEGIIGKDGRNIRFDDWNRLREVADFSALYLHLDQTAVPGPGRPPS